MVSSTDHCSVSCFWMCFTRASTFSAGPGSSASRNATAACSSWITSFIHSSEVWCWMMNSSSSWLAGVDSGACAESTWSSLR